MTYGCTGKLNGELRQGPKGAYQCAYNDKIARFKALLISGSVCVNVMSDFGVIEQY